MLGSKTKLLTLGMVTLALTACGGSSNESVDNSEVETPVVDTPTTETPTTETPTEETPTDETPTDGTPSSEVLHSAFLEFDGDNVTVVQDGADVIIETNGLPNHTSPYWSTSHMLYVEPTVANPNQMAPGTIDEFMGSYTLTVPNSPTQAERSSATGLGAIGIAISGSVIYNDEEGPGIPLDNAAGGLDFNGAHTGPQSYHYHLEPVSFSDDDSNLIGVMADGFFLYGRKCNSTGDYPTDLDESGGHFSITQHSQEPEYHYHIQNELYLNAYYILFPGDYQGTPNAIQ